jgi:DNA-binding GntR family transcriptional regulator
LINEAEIVTRLMVHENWRFRPHYRQIADWLRSARIGRVVQAQMTLLTSGLIPDAQGRLPLIERQPFIATLSRALVMEILIHQIDTLRFLLGEMTVAQARLGKACATTSGEEDIYLRHLRERHFRGVHEANDAFHLTLFAACENPYLVESIKHYMWLSLPVRAKKTADVAHASAAARDHHVMIQLLKGTDSWALAQLCVDHLQQAKNDYLHGAEGSRFGS